MCIVSLRTGSANQRESSEQASGVRTVTKPTSSANSSELNQKYCPRLFGDQANQASQKMNELDALRQEAETLKITIRVSDRSGFVWWNASVKYELA